MNRRGFLRVLGIGAAAASMPKAFGALVALKPTAAPVVLAPAVAPFTAADLTFSLADFERRVLRPAMAAMHTAFERDALGLYE